jgi:hypothetical protein
MLGSWPTLPTSPWNGDQPVYPLATRTYMIERFNEEGGSTGPKAATVGVIQDGAPSLTFWLADPAGAETVEQGTEITLKWVTKNVDTCTAGHSWSGTKATSGTHITIPSSAGHYYYHLQCEDTITGKMTDLQVINLIVTSGAVIPPSTLDVEITTDVGNETTIGNDVKWTATASGGSGIYTFDGWSGDVSGTGTDLGNGVNFIEDTVSAKGTINVRVDVHDSAGNTAFDIFPLTVKDDRKPQ